MGVVFLRYGRKWIEKFVFLVLQLFQLYCKGVEWGFFFGQILNLVELVSVSVNYVDFLFFCCVFDVDVYNQEIFCLRNVVIVKFKIN